MSTILGIRAVQINPENQSDHPAAFGPADTQHAQSLYPVIRTLETRAANVYALGDCVEVEGLNLPYVQPLMVQARALAATFTGTPAPVVYPPMPVMVKTPAHPVVVLPPKPEAIGDWQIDSSDAGVCARHTGGNGRLQGFVLTGGETRRRSALMKDFVA